MCHIHLGSAPIYLETFFKGFEFVLLKLTRPWLIWAVWTLLSVRYHAWPQLSFLEVFSMCPWYVYTQAKP